MEKDAQHTDELPTGGQEPAVPARERLQKRLVTWLKSISSVLRGLVAKGGRAYHALFRSGDGKTTEDLRGAFGHLHFKRIGVGALLVVLGMYLASGLYMVNPGEEAVERLFGRVVKERIGEGLHYRLPWPFQQVDKVNVLGIRREGIGLILPEHRGVHSSPRKIQILTGDENIVDLQMVIQYRISDPAQYLFNVDYRPYQLINEVIRWTVTRIGSDMRVDDILTIAKEEIQRAVQAEAQRLLDGYKSGLSIVTVNIKKMYPPDEVADAFRDVASAREDKARTINQAEGYRNSVLPRAKGEAQKLLREAEGYQAEVVNKASGEAQRFSQMLAEYQRSARTTSVDVTLERLYLETMEKIMPRVKKYIVNSGGQGTANLRFIEEK